ncbi:MAG: flavodoxin-dependent (E)-4-hydroxy-3-methylbut-2-enyl-diphosphate synthase [Clostridia bacterium]|nr:flavodoxin-dependent (E)-4-hydroxy-3-methylbut-2-enyl-diphosphate synthase [Clostridia bacterium]
MRRHVYCGNIKIGADAPISIQSMTKTNTKDVAATLHQIFRLQEAGCQIVRIAVPDMEAVEAFRQIKLGTSVPLVADIHFDYKLAIAAIESGADKIRINPGNIGSKERVKEVLYKAGEFGIPVRIGVNSGSLEAALLKKYAGATPEALCESALLAIENAESLGFYDMVISLKSADVKTNHAAHKLFAQRSKLPIHIGLTEAGIGAEARIKSSIALGALILEGIGNTMRISLTGDPVEEVVLAKEILKATGERKVGIDFVSCPTCGRTKVNLAHIAEKIKSELEPLSLQLEKEGKFLRVAVMGCEVNGPGEAAHADVGVACGKEIGLIMEDGTPLKTVPESDIVKELASLIHKKTIAK